MNSPSVTADLLCSAADASRVHKTLVRPLKRMINGLTINVVHVDVSAAIPDSSGVWVVLTRRSFDRESALAATMLDKWSKSISSNLLLLDPVRVNNVLDKRRAIVGRNESEVLLELYRRLAQDNVQQPRPTELFGREHDTTRLVSALTDATIRLISVLGIGGQGKTSLVRQALLRTPVKHCWIDVADNPKLSRLIERIQRSLGAPIDGESQTLLNQLDGFDGLLILDNFESLLHDGVLPGDLGRFLLLVMGAGTTRIALTSRLDIPSLVHEHSINPYTLRLDGIDSAAVSNLLARMGTYADESTLNRIVQWSSGNPLAIKLLASSVLELYGGDFSKFRWEAHGPLPDITRLINEHLTALNDDDLRMIQFLAWERTSLPISVVDAWLQGAASTQTTLLRLSRRYLIEYNTASGEVSLHPLVRESVISDIVTRLIAELGDRHEDATWSTLAGVLLLNPQSSGRIQEEQLLTLRHVVKALQSRSLRSPKQWKKKIEALASIAQSNSDTTTHLPANVLSIARAAETSIAGLNLSELFFWHADFRGLDLQGVDLRRCEIESCEFSDDFGPVTCVAGMPGAQDLDLIAGTFEGHVRTWSTDGVLISSTPVATDWISAFAPLDSRNIAVAAVDGSLSILNTRSQSVRHLTDLHPGQIRDLDVKDGDIWAAVTSGGIYVVSAIHGDQREFWRGSFRLKFLTLQAEGLVACGGDDDFVRIMNADGVVISELQTTSGAWTRCGKFVDDATLVVGDDAGILYIWSRRRDDQWELLRTASHGSRIWSLDVDTRERRVYSAGNDGAIRVWNLNDLEMVGTLKIHSSWVRSVFFEQNSGALLSGGEDQRAIRWMPDAFEAKYVKTGYSRRVFSSAFVGENDLVCATGDHRLVAFRSWRTNLSTESWRGHQDQVFSLHCAAGLVASGSDDGEVRLWTNDGTLLAQSRPHEGWVGAVRISHDGTRLASGSDDKTIAIFDVVSGRVVAQRATHEGRVSGISFLDGANIIACSEDGSVGVFDGTSLQAKAHVQLSVGPLYALSNHAGDILVGGAFGRWFRLSLPDLEIQETGDVGVPIWSVDINPKDGTFALGLDDGRVVLVGVGKEEMVVVRHARQVWSVRWSNDGRYLVTGSEDATSRALDMHTGDDVTVTPPSMYDGLQLTGVSGLRNGERDVLKRLGAVW